MSDCIPNVCFVCGSSKSGKKALIKDLLSITDNDFVSSNEYTWEISNKYYTSKIILKLLNNTSSQININKCQAIIFILDLTKNMDEIKTDLNGWYTIFKDNCDNYQCNLLIGNYPTKCSNDNINDIEKDKIKIHEYLQGWCIDNCFEFIPSPYIATDNNNNDSNLYDGKSVLFKSFDVSDIGHIRISNALQCVMWPNMQKNVSKKNTVSTQSLLSKYKTDDDTKISDNNTDQNQNTAIDDGKTHESNDNNNSTNKGSNNNANNDDNKVSNNDDNDDDCIVNEDENNTDKSNKIINDLLHEHERQYYNKNNTNESFNLENRMNEFNSLINEMKNVRQGALDKRWNDQERRKRAAAAAMKLFNFMDFGDDDDSESTNNNNNNNNNDSNNNSSNNGNTNINPYIDNELMNTISTDIANDKQKVNQLKKTNK